jgi:hypothetical protein
MPRIGLVTEGTYDLRAYVPFIRRLNATPLEIVERLCGGPVGGRLTGILTAFKYQQPTLDRAVIVSDAHGKNPEALRAELARQAEHLNLPFPVEYVVVVQEMEAILLCDPPAIVEACTAISGITVGLPNVTHNPESLANPKEKLEQILNERKVGYTKDVAEAIAMRATVENERGASYWSPSFRRFRNAVTL